MRRTVSTIKSLRSHQLDVLLYDPECLRRTIVQVDRASSVRDDVGVKVLSRGEQVLREFEEISGSVDCLVAVSAAEGTVERS